jgi:hypothetical protein
MADIDGPKVADSFYGYLFQENAPAITTADRHVTQTAHALHFAISKLRVEDCSFIRWVPFIHLGI